jgi:hypothetical protein
VSDYIKWAALRDVLVFGLVVGAGLPALFAVGVRALAGPGARDSAGHRSRMRLAAAYVCFAIVVGAVTSAIVYIANGGH